MGFSDWFRPGLLTRHGTSPQYLYLFRHALICDAAYETLLRSSHGREIHARVLECLGVNPEAAPEILAHHAEAAGAAERAIDYWRQAGERAVARGAYHEAIAQFTRALRLNTDMSGSSRWQLSELALQIQLGQARSPRRRS